MPPAWEETLITAANWVFNSFYSRTSLKRNGRIMVGTNVRVRGLRLTLGEVHKLYLRWMMWKTKERTPTRCIISDYMTTTMESSNNTYPDELDTSRWGFLLINLNNIQCARCKKCVSSLIYWVIENKNCSPDDTWPGQWPWIKFRFIISYLIIFVWNCTADQYCSWVCKKCAKWVS